MKLHLPLLLLAAQPLGAETLVAARVLRAQSVLSPEDVLQRQGATPGALTSPEQAVGREARVTLFPGRAIRAEDLGPPALVERNGRVTLQYRQGALDILTEGRALARGGAGDVIRAMNLQSRTTVIGRIGADGIVSVSP